MAGLYNSIICVVKDQYALSQTKKTLKKENLQNISIEVLPPNRKFSYPKSSFDLIIISSLENCVTSNDQYNSQFFMHFISELQYLLNPSGVIGLILENSISVHVKKFKQNNFFSTTRIFKAIGFKHLNPFYFVFSNNKLSEIWPIYDKNHPGDIDHVSLKRKIKLWVLRSRLMRPFHLKYLFIASKHGNYVNILDHFISTIETNIKTSTPLMLKKFYIPSTGSKIILYLLNGKHKELIARLSLYRDGRLLKINSSAKKKLSKMNISMKIPEEFHENSFYGYPYAVEEKISGFSIVSNMVNLDKIFKAAAKELYILKKETIFRPTVVDDSQTELINKRIEGFEKLFPLNYRPRIESIQLMATILVANFIMPITYEHGDYKIENIIVDKNRDVINGIIDWDYFNEKGLPFFDLFRLISSFYQLRSGESSNNVFLKKILVLEFDNHVRDEFERFLDLYQLSSKQAQLLAVCYWLNLKNRGHNQEKISMPLLEQYMPIISAIEDVLDDLKDLSNE